MLDHIDRVGIYQAQNGYGPRLTDRQHRRVNKKSRHQSPEAQARRDTKIRQAVHAIAERRRKAVQPTP